MFWTSLVAAQQPTPFAPPELPPLVVGLGKDEAEEAAAADDGGGSDDDEDDDTDGTGTAESGNVASAAVAAAAVAGLAESATTAEENAGGGVAVDDEFGKAADAAELAVALIPDAPRAVELDPARSGTTGADACSSGTDVASGRTVGATASVPASGL